MASPSFAPTPLGERRISLAKIDAVVSARLGPTRGLGNSQPACFNRQVAMYLAARFGRWSTTVIGRFYNGRLREECLNTSWFRNLFDARRQIAAWRDHYNHVRPHSSLDYRTPPRVRGASRRVSIQRWGKGRGLKHRPLPSHSHPRSKRGSSHRKLSYARMNGFGGKVTVAIVLAETALVAAISAVAYPARDKGAFDNL